VNFFDRSTAGSAFIYNSGNLNFFDRSTAGSAGIDNFFGTANFFDRSTAGSASIVADLGVTNFFDNSTAGSAILGATDAYGEDSSPGFIVFWDSSQGGTAQIQFFEDPLQDLDLGALDISFHNAPGVTIGSLEGDGNVFLGANNLTVGSNNLS